MNSPEVDLSKKKPLEGIVPGTFKLVSDRYLAQVIKDPGERTRITETTLSVVENLNGIFNLGYPITLDISKLSEASLDYKYYKSVGRKLCAYFSYYEEKPDFPTRGVLTLDHYNYLESAIVSKGIFPWELACSLAHEMHHAYMYDKDHDAITAEKAKCIEGIIEYDQLSHELAANVFAYQYIALIKPKGMKDRIEQWLCLNNLRTTIHRQEKAGKKLK